MKAFVVDAHDSFVHTICLYLRRMGIDVEVKRNTQVEVGHLLASQPDFVVLGPGPGHPADSGYVELLDDMISRRMPVLGVCLGHQAIALAFGAEVVRADNLMHGKTSRISHDGEGLFQGIGNPFEAIRYHSLVVESVAHPLWVTARSDDDHYVMGLRHRDALIESVQFHPESVGTGAGDTLLRNFVTRVGHAAGSSVGQRPG